MKTQIVIPSFRRAYLCISHKLFTDCLVCVPESDEEEYRKQGITNLLVHPDTVVGIAPKRNWILKRFQKVPVFMVDDDMESFHRLYVGPGERSKIDEVGFAQQVIDHGAQMAHDMGAFMFGLGAFADVRLFDPSKPFSLTGFICGGAMGFLPGHGMEFDERFITRDDFDICYQNAFRHRICFRDHRFAFNTVQMYRRQGGLAAYRTMDTDQASIRLLLQKYGKEVVHQTGKFDGPIETVKAILPY